MKRAVIKLQRRIRIALKKSRNISLPHERLGAKIGIGAEAVYLRPRVGTLKNIALFQKFCRFFHKRRGIEGSRQKEQQADARERLRLWRNGYT